MLFRSSLARAIVASQPHHTTHLSSAIGWLNENTEADRIVVLTDEQSHDGSRTPLMEKAYLINVAAYKYGISYDDFIHINGFSEAVVTYLTEYEKFMSRQG